MAYTPGAFGYDPTLVPPPQQPQQPPPAQSGGNNYLSNYLAGPGPQQRQDVVDAHHTQVQGNVENYGGDLGSYGYAKDLAYETSPMRWDQSNAERTSDQIGNYSYGGYEGGAQDAIDSMRGNVSPYTGALTGYADYAMGQGAQGAADYGQGMQGVYGTADTLTNYAQQGPGPSLAQAQLDANTSMAMRQQLAMAGSGRGAGGGAAAFRQAGDNQALIQGQANASAGMLQAQEAADWRQAQLQAYGAAGQLYGQGAGMGAGYSQGMTDTAVGAQESAGGMQLGAEQVANDINMAALTGSMGYEGNLSDIYGINRGVPAGPGEPGAYEWINTGIKAAGTVAEYYSDVRAKKNIQPASALDAVAEAQPYTYDYIDPERHGEGRYIGPMAQDLEGAPGVVQTGKDGKKTIDPGRLTTLNTSAIAELNNKVDSIAAQNMGWDVGIGEAQIERSGETTALPPEQEKQFQAWAKQNNINDVDHPDSNYDYRGFWKGSGGSKIRGGVDHFPDTYKQHGHPTFSTESSYSAGPNDGGTWDGERFVPPWEVEIGTATIERPMPSAAPSPSSTPAQLSPFQKEMLKRTGKVPHGAFDLSGPQGPAAPILPSKEQIQEWRTNAQPAPAAQPQTGPTSPVAYSGDPGRIAFEQGKYGNTPVFGQPAPDSPEAEAETGGFLDFFLGSSVGQHVSDVADEEKLNMEKRQYFRAPPREDVAL